MVGGLGFGVFWREDGSLVGEEGSSVGRGSRSMQVEIRVLGVPRVSRSLWVRRLEGWA